MFHFLMAFFLRRRKQRQAEKELKEKRAESSKEDFGQPKEKDG